VKTPFEREFAIAASPFVVLISLLMVFKSK